MSDKMNQRGRDWGFKDTYILIAKIEGHLTWRVIGNSRKLESLVEQLRNPELKITQSRFLKMDGDTGRIIEDEKEGPKRK